MVSQLLERFGIRPPSVSAATFVLAINVGLLEELSAPVTSLAEG